LAACCFLLGCTAAASPRAASNDRKNSAEAALKPPRPQLAPSEANGRATADLRPSTSAVPPAVGSRSVQPGDTARSFGIRLSANPPREGADGECPDALRSLALAGLEAVHRHASPSNWQHLASVKEQAGAAVYSRELPGTKIRQFFTTATFYDTTAETVWRGLDADRFLWDKTFQSPFTPLLRHKISASPDTAVDVVAYATSPAAAGVISGRSFVDLRATQVTFQDEGNYRLMQIQSSVSTALGRGIGEHELRASDWLSMTDGQKLQRADNLEGSGSLVRERLENGQRVVDVRMLSAASVGGRLPVSLVNNAMAGAMITCMSGLSKYCKKMNRVHTPAD